LAKAKATAKAKSKVKMGKKVDRSPKPPEERVEAELVEKNYKASEGDDALKDNEHFDFEAHEEAQKDAASAGATVAAGALIQETPPSSQMNPYVSQEEQGMEMRPAIVGPPPYGSPDAITAASRLVPLNQHPLQAHHLPEGSTAAISEDFGNGYDGTLKGADTVTQRPSAPQTAVDASVDATDSAKELAETEGVDLSKVKGTGADGRITKGDVDDYLDELQAQATGNGD
jgi:pyruvate/2-oxoglutarate dehydrogenase complex dihydrolipoamide acyltransferase (E2) component